MLRPVPAATALAALLFTVSLEAGAAPPGDRPDGFDLSCPARSCSSS